MLNLLIRLCLANMPDLDPNQRYVCVDGRPTAVWLS